MAARGRRNRPGRDLAVEERGFPMIRACWAAMALGGWLLKAVVGLVGCIVLVGAVVPPSAPEPRPGGPVHPADTVVLNIPEGRPAGNLTVVDASGRELARLTHWPGGHTVVVTRRAAGPTVGTYHNAGGSVAFLVTGSARETEIHIAPDGAVKTIASQSSRVISPLGPANAQAAEPPGVHRSATADRGEPDPPG